LGRLIFVGTATFQRGRVDRAVNPDDAVAGGAAGHPARSDGISSRVFLRPSGIGADADPGLRWYERHQISEWFQSASGRRLIGLLFVGTAATAIIALPLRRVAVQAFERPVWVGMALIVTGLIVAATKFLPGGMVREGGTTWRQSVLVGLAQGLAIFPGLSRSGMTIAVGLGGGLERSWAARFSFLLSVPAIAAVTIVQMVETQSEMAAAGNGLGLASIAGGIAAGITGYFALQVVIKTVSSNIFHRFAWYCVPLGILVVVLVAGGR
jgi:undecaprenyl-diphosphatase